MLHAARAAFPSGLTPVECTTLPSSLADSVCLSPGSRRISPPVVSRPPSEPSASGIIARPSGRQTPIATYSSQPISTPAAGTGSGQSC